MTEQKPTGERRMKQESAEKQLRRLLWNALSDYVSASYYVYICAEICPNKKPADIHNCYMNCKTCNDAELTRKLFYSRLKSFNKNKKSIMAYVEPIQEACTLLIEKHIKANTVMVNKNLVYVPRKAYCIQNNIMEFPPMICGLEIKADDLPEDYTFIVTEVAETEREKYGAKVRKETAKEIYAKVKELNQRSGNANSGYVFQTELGIDHARQERLLKEFIKEQYNIDVEDEE